MHAANQTIMTTAIFIKKQNNSTATRSIESAGRLKLELDFLLKAILVDKIGKFKYAYSSLKSKELRWGLCNANLPFPEDFSKEDIDL